MPLIIKNKADRVALQFGQRSAHRSTSELVDQLQETLRRELAQHAIELAEKQHELAAALCDVAERQYLLAKREREAAFVAAPSPSAMKH